MNCIKYAAINCEVKSRRCGQIVAYFTAQSQTPVLELRRRTSVCRKVLVGILMDYIQYKYTLLTKTV